MRIPTQFNLRALSLLTIASAGVLAALTQSGPVGALFAGALCLTAGSLMGRPGAITGVASGACYSVLGLTVAAVGFPQLVWPGEGLFFVYWWLATGALVGAVLGSLANRHDFPARSAPLSWFASAHLHVIAGTLLSFTVVGLSGHLPGGGYAALEAGEWRPKLLGGWAASPEPVEEELEEPEGFNEVEIELTGIDYGEPPPPFRPALETPERLDVLAWRMPSRVVPPRETVEARVTQLLDPARGAAAMEWLLGCDDAIVPALEEIRQEASAELRQEIDVALGSFRSDTGSGGLTLTLLVDKTLLKPGDSVTFTTVVRNTLSEPINLCVGWGRSTADISLEMGWSLRSFKGPDRTKPNFPGFTAGRCGTGTSPVCTTLRPGAAQKFLMPARFAPTLTATPGRGAVPASSLVFRDGYTYLQLTGDMHHLRVMQRATESSYEARGYDGRTRHGTFDRSARNWIGEAYSNDVLVRVEP